MKRIAAPVVGGIASALFLLLIVFPAIHALWSDREGGEPALPSPGGQYEQTPR